jgi:hypothetical protein
MLTNHLKNLLITRSLPTTGIEVTRNYFGKPEFLVEQEYLKHASRIRPPQSIGADKHVQRMSCETPGEVPRGPDEKMLISRVAVQKTTSGDSTRE